MAIACEHMPFVFWFFLLASDLLWVCLLLAFFWLWRAYGWVWVCLLLACFWLLRDFDGALGLVCLLLACFLLLRAVAASCRICNVADEEGGNTEPIDTPILPKGDDSSDPGHAPKPPSENDNVADEEGGNTEPIEDEEGGNKESNVEEPLLPVGPARSDAPAPPDRWDKAAAERALPLPLIALPLAKLCVPSRAS